MRSARSPRPMLPSRLATARNACVMGIYQTTRRDEPLSAIRPLLLLRLARRPETGNCGHTGGGGRTTRARNTHLLAPPPPPAGPTDTLLPCSSPCSRQLLSVRACAARQRHAVSNAHTQSGCTLVLTYTSACTCTAIGATLC